MEPYEDGLLLSALETAPKHRGKGYATVLVREVLNQLEGTAVYSHISLRNRGSLQVHRKCGFRKLLDHARYLDGSVHTDSVTMIFET